MAICLFLLIYRHIENKGSLERFRNANGYLIRVDYGLDFYVAKVVRDMLLLYIKQY